MKSSKYIAAGISVVALIWILSGIFFSGSGSNAKESVLGTDPTTKVAEVRVRDIAAQSYANDIVVTGRTNASRTVQIKAKTKGQIQVLLKEKGVRVEEHEVIARIELSDREAKVIEAKQRFAQRQIEYDAAKSLEDKGFNSKVTLTRSLADLETARAVLTKVVIDQENTKIKAPFKGLIYDQMIEVGDYVSVGDTMFTVVDMDPIELVVFVSERNISSIRLGHNASAEFYNGDTVTGKVSYIAPVAYQATRTFRVEISTPNPGYSIKDGLTAKVRISVEEKKAHKISPSVLSLNDVGQIGVKIVDAQNKVQFVPVTILSDTSDYMWILGLPENVKLITVGQDFVSHGQAVRPVAADGDGLL
ncbi:MAG: efflux RND transporter periplasmic adaptor subunit [Candidatus Scalindua sp.]|jgi:multidrug efflux system membrane fusion protein|nr:efflux RND transporter periplasmic adaptor subunit [Candidatus Scalindua sp.]MBT5304806.1 efflux RND transporter periplasmic adaptor subunit [Candidatus Scalindua sp.]MBT6228329.1 efflux RND transporter periplasmic adaptor subunit [Candidatus Scalindua sp.]MBT6562152.1 efflux RND transporter periplasmic adaptor subunit [Candidatus Scalindua sp.]MBT7210673.1 efflux RND transporter periplasmic adaptor subunit [Candidatus Scalindua sp.]